MLLTHVLCDFLDLVGFGCASVCRRHIDLCTYFFVFIANGTAYFVGFGFERREAQRRNGK